MAAIITDDFRRNSATFLINDIIDKNAGSTDDSPEQELGGYEYFVGIGKSDSWDNDTSGNAEADQNFSTPLPNGSVAESQEVIDNLIGAVAVKIDSAKHVIPRINYVPARRYKRWNKYDPDMFNVSTDSVGTVYPCYAVHNDKLYICLDNNYDAQYQANGSEIPGATSVAPTGTSTSKDPTGFISHAAAGGGDGYLWAYISDVETSGIFNTDQFVQITNSETGTGAAAATGGVIYGFEIQNGGASLTTSTGGQNGDFQLVISDATGKDPKILDCQATITNGAVVGFTCASLDTVGEIKTHKDVERASVRMTATVAAQASTDPIIKPLIAPADGFGAVPTNDLPAFYVGLSVNFNDNTGGELPTSVTYRQISVLRNPTRQALNDSPEPSGKGTYDLNEVYNALRRFKVTANTNLSTITAGDIITESTADGNYDGNADGSGDSVNDYNKAKAFVDYTETVGSDYYIYFHQNESSKVNQNDFTTGDATNTKITVTKASDGSTIQEYTYESTSLLQTDHPEYKPRTGDVMFLENRKPIQRAANQEEEIKLVIQF